VNTVWTPEALAVALGVLTAAVCASAIQLARTYSQVVNLVEGVNRAGINIRGARGASGGGGLNRMAQRQVASVASPLLPVDPVAQLEGVTVSPARAPTGPVDCGPACVVSCIEEIKGCWSADELLRLRYFGAVDSRLTTARDLVGMLNANRIKAHAREGVSAEVAQQEITRNWAAGRPSVVLGDWVSRGVGHWVKFLGDRGGAVVMDPYYGAPRVIPWPTFALLFDGDYVHVDEPPTA
jgi:hypothetical protein